MALKMKKNWIRITLLFLLTGILLFFFFRSLEWSEVWRSMAEVKPLLFVLVVLLAPVNLLTRAIRWDYLLRHEKKGITLYSRFAATAVGFTVTYLLPGRLGELAKPLFLAYKENMKKGFVLGTQLVERIFDIFTNCFLLGVFLLFNSLYSSSFNPDKQTYAILKWSGIGGVVFATIMMLLILSLYFYREKTMSVISRLLKPFPKKVTASIIKLLDEFFEGLKFFHSLRNLIVYILLSLVVWLGIDFFYWIVFFAFGLSVPYAAIIPYVFMTAVGASIPTPGMVGGYHYFSKLGLTAFFPISDSKAAGMTIVVHALQLVITCLIGYAILWKEGISLLQIRKLGENGDR